jgi:predicted Zn-dependent protease
MIRVEDGVQIWVEDLLVKRDLVAGLESELVKRVAFRLGARSPEVRPWIVSRPPAVTGATASSGSAGEGLSIAAVASTEHEGADAHREAYEIYQRAHNEWQTLQRHRMQDGLQHLLRATELDPSLIEARIDLVNLCVTQCFYGFMSPTVEADIVLHTTESIPDLPTRAEAVLPALGWISFHFGRNLPGALKSMALSAYLPHDPWVTRVRSMLALSRHRFGEAIDLLRATIQLDPYAPWLQARLAWALHLSGEAGESVDQIQHALRLFPEHEGASLYGAVILAHNGEAARATELAHELAQRLPYFDLATSSHKG